jgi:hypothetical protein
MFKIQHMGLQLDCGNVIWMDHQNYLLESQALFHIAQFGGNDALRYMGKKIPLMLDYPNFGSKALIENQLMR